MGKKKKNSLAHDVIDAVATVAGSTAAVKVTLLGTAVGQPVAGALGGAYAGKKVRDEINSLKTPEGREKWGERLDNLGENTRNNPCPGA
ncbi:hypothetical protein [Streptosporangium sp. NPDC006930]|uniref:hypothetical protein n=1 Tax=unclassified Streptosporangium TaxID=2632669 RepID=UPI00342E57A9